MSTKSTFGTRLRQLREAAGLTQKDLVERTRIAQRSITRYETDASAPSWQAVVMLAGAIGVEPAALLPPARRRGTAGQCRVNGRLAKSMLSLTRIVGTLATHPGTARDRLLEVLGEVVVLQGADFPAPIARHWATLRLELDRRTEETGTLTAAVQRLQNKTAARWAQSLWELHQRLAIHLVGGE